MKFLSGRFRHVILLNYRIDAGLLAPFLPPCTEPDLLNGHSYVSLVGVRCLELRLYGIPLPLYRNYPQVNLRFYVRRTVDDGSRRPGVVFVRQTVPHRLVAWTARRFFNERAAAHRLFCTVEKTGQETEKVEYRWEAGSRRYFIGTTYRRAPHFAVPAVERDFFVNRYWGYSMLPDRGCFEYRFDHPPWMAYRSMDNEATASVGDFYGPPFSAVLAACPDSAFVGQGSKISLARGRRL